MIEKDGLQKYANVYNPSGMKSLLWKMPKVKEMHKSELSVGMVVTNRGDLQWRGGRCQAELLCCQNHHNKRKEDKILRAILMWFVFP